MTDELPFETDLAAIIQRKTEALAKGGPISPALIKQVMMSLAEVIEPPEFDTDVVVNEDQSVTITSRVIPYR